MVKKVIKLIAISEVIILATYFISFSFYMNVQISFLSSLFIIIGSSFAYRRLVNTQVSSDMVEEKRDLLDEIEDPYELYDDKVNDEVREGTPINNAPAEELDLKAIVKEERKKIKTLSVASMKQGLKGGASLFRLVPYLFLVLGFIALKNNELLDIVVYLPSLLFGIIVGSISSKEIFS
ncbi:hypothetical protein [Sulfurimonas sp.]|uniref:hypothetical protein n=1 Tax=Sulfurimonas sp. TaxID=2022749 RepID=UPI003A7F4F6D